VPGTRCGDLPGGCPAYEHSQLIKARWSRLGPGADHRA
jgi:hypothetical protein